MHHIFMMVIIGIVVPCYFSGAQTIVSIPLDRFLEDPGLYVSELDSVVAVGNQLRVSGSRKKNRCVDQVVIREMLALKSADSSPACFFEHTPEELDAYDDFDEEFRRRPQGHDGGLIVMQWQRNRFTQNVRLVSLERDAKTARIMFEADYLLKRMIMGKKRIGVNRLSSFAGYAQAEKLKGMKGSGGTNRSRFETMFRLIPDTIVEKHNADTISIDRVMFRLVPDDSAAISDYDGVEARWAKLFSNQAGRIMAKHAAFRNVADLFRLYYMVTRYGPEGDGKTAKARGANPVPDRIPAIKISEILEIPSPVINEPGRIQFAWLLLSGGISFDFSRAVIVVQRL